MTTSNLFDFVPQGTPVSPFASLPISGCDFEEGRDRERLVRQVDCILAVALGGEWWTLQRLTAALRKRYPRVGFPENSVQAQLRNLRKVGYVVERRHVKSGLFQYRVLPPVDPGVAQSLRGAEMEVAVA